MHVGINGLHLVAGGSGALRYADELLRALCRRPDAPRLTVFVSRDAPESLLRSDWAGEVRWVHVPVPAAGPATALLQAGGLAPLALARRVDVLHSLAGVGPPRVPRLMASVVTLLDVIWLLLPDQVSMTAAERASWIRMTRLATRTATRVIAISEAGATDIAGAYGIARERIDVTPLGVAEVARATPTPEAELRTRLGLGEGPLLLSVGQQQPYKAQDQLIRALARLDDPSIQLALPGPPTAHGETLAQVAASLGVAERVHLLGLVSDADLEGLYSAATAVVQPSRMEGFGLPALEAMQRGAALACSERSALGEVVGDAALRFDPDDLDAIVAACERLFGDPLLREDLARRGVRRAARFTWDATATATLASYERAFAARR